MFRPSLPCLPLAQEVAEQFEGDEDIPLTPLQAPALSGTPLKLFLALAESPLAGPVLEELFLPEDPSFLPNTAGWPREQPPLSGPQLLALVAPGGGELPAPERAAAAFQRLWPRQEDGDEAAAADGASAGAGQQQQQKQQGPQRRTAADYRGAYASGAATPSDVAERIISAVEASERLSPPMRFFVAHDPQLLRAAAAASSERWAAGRPLSPLDGVPFAVKDAIDALPYPTTSGTAFMEGWRTPTHSLAGVDALLAAGALLVGKATLHEIGLGTTGLNTVTGTARNPHSPAHHTGGSSSGSTALVAAGLCPFALGSDGGGSIRVPSAACGVVGLKPTHERVGKAVGVPPIDASVSVVGPIAGTVADCALAYALLGNTGQLPGHAPPPVLLPALGGERSGSGRPLEGRKAGVYWRWFDMAAPPVAAACRAGLALLQAAGLEVVPLLVPELALLRAAHSCAIACEMRNNFHAALLDGGTRRQLNAETRVSLAVAAGFEGAHYLQAAKIRTRFDTHFRRIFRRCDFLITPTLPCTAPPVKPAALAGGETDLSTTTALMLYMHGANMAGFPAISVPVGAVPSTHAAGSAQPQQRAASAGAAGEAAGRPSRPLLPVGLQLMAPCWHEASLLHAAAVLEAAVAEAGAAPPLPQVWYDPLAASSS